MCTVGLELSLDTAIAFFQIADLFGTGSCLNWPRFVDTCGQSYKAPMIINYDSRVVPDLKIPHITTLES